MGKMARRKRARYGSIHFQAVKSTRDSITQLTKKWESARLDAHNLRQQRAAVLRAVTALRLRAFQLRKRHIDAKRLEAFIDRLDERVKGLDSAIFTTEDIANRMRKEIAYLEKVEEEQVVKREHDRANVQQEIAHARAPAELLSRYERMRAIMESEKPEGWEDALTHLDVLIEQTRKKLK